MSAPRVEHAVVAVVLSRKWSIRAIADLFPLAQPKVIALGVFFSGDSEGLLVINLREFSWVWRWEEPA